jgi:hypothetical protein
LGKKKKYHSLHLLIAGLKLTISVHKLPAGVFSNVFSFSYVIVDDFSIFPPVVNG